jgi:predicted amidophosphoribosyltransferase
LLALRGESIQGEATIPVCSEDRVLTNRNANDSIDWFGEMVAEYLDSCHVQPPFSLVPVPTSKSTLESSAGPWTTLLAISIASSGLDDVSVEDVLRWKQPLDPPSQRQDTVAELYENLAVLKPLPPESPVVLVDYLFTGSATLRACAARLRQQGAQVLFALCAGRTATQSSHDPFAVVTGAVHRYQPGH